jgi:tetratricopeptide (TPR) repeat protein
MTLFLTLLSLASATEPDPVDLASVLIRDGHWERASTALAGVVPDDDDASRFYTLTGLIAVHDTRHSDAVTAFQRARALGATDPVVAVHLAQELLAIEQPADALAVLDGPTYTLAASWVLQSRAHAALGDGEASYSALHTGRERFAGDASLAVAQAIFLAQRGLASDAIAVCSDVITLGQPIDVLRVAEALRQTHPMAAVRVVEAAQLVHPTDADVPVHLAAAWLAAGVPAAAGAVLQRAAEQDPGLYVAAATAFQEAGQLDRALYLNSRVIDPVDKARQRLGLLIAAGRYDAALALDDRLARLGLMNEDGVRYALAWTQFQLGEYTASDHRLAGISDPEVFARATSLRTAISSCLEAPWSCR